MAAAPVQGQRLREDGEFVLWRARWDDSPGLANPTLAPGSPTSVLVLSAVLEQPAARTLRKLEHELSLASELNPAWAVRPLALTQHFGHPALLLEDPGGELLQRRIGRPCELTEFLGLAIAITGVLAQAHACELIHKDLNPANILVTASGQIFLTGFGIASLALREGQTQQSATGPAGTPAYMSPEQTGRLDLSIDSRSDLYSLGVTLFELLTGKLPFRAADPLDWFHCHIARQPASPLHYRPTLAEPIAHILLKLLAKSADERYQTALGLEADWQRCLQQWRQDGRVVTFALARDDAPKRLNAPQALFGRRHELDLLEATYNEVTTTGASALVLVTGYAGVGKSALVQEFHRRRAYAPCWFATAKADPAQSDIPYAALVKALGPLVQQLLGRPTSEITRWRDSLQRALGNSGQLVINLIPELELIVGPQPPMADAPPQDVLHRFRRVMRRFVGVFATSEQPLVLFLDDLQWLDAATLNLLEHLLTHSDLRHLLIIAACRDCEIDASHALTAALHSLRASCAKVGQVALPPLERADIERLVSAMLHCPRERVGELARLVHLKTHGNPFFATQFLSNLESQGLLKWRGANAGWRWDLEPICALQFTDNVAHLLVERLGRLSGRTLQALQCLACLGGTADIDTLKWTLEVSEQGLHRALAEAVLAGLVMRIDEAYRLLHDRIREATYSLIPEQERAAIHLRIGRALHSHLIAAETQEHVFTIVNQLNRARELIQGESERLELAGLNLFAALRACQSSAYASALSLIQTGSALLPQTRWIRCHELAFDLEVRRSECELFTGQLEVAETRLRALAAHASNPTESAQVTCLLETIYENLGRIERSVEICLQFLGQHNIDVGPTPAEYDVQREYATLWKQLGTREVEDLTHLPILGDPQQRAVLDVLAALLAPAFLSDHISLFRFAIGRMANLSLQWGNSDAAPLAYTYLNFIVGPELGDYRMGFQFGNLAVELIEKGLHRFKSRVELMFGATVVPWTQPMSRGIVWVRRSLESAQEAGDLTFACYSWFMLFPYRLCSGEPLEEVQREAERALQFARAQRSFMVDLILPQVAFLRALRGETEELSSFSGSEFDESAYARGLEQDPGLDDRVCWYWLRKLLTYFLAGDYPAAINAASRTRSHPWRTSTLFYISSDYHFYTALAHAACCDDLATSQQQTHRDAMTTHARSLANLAANCPENFGARANLTAAELARLEGRDADAHRLYEKAIAAARAHGYVHDEALALELAGAFYASRALDTVANDLLRRAHAGYERWGALAKVRLLERRYPMLRHHSALALAGVAPSASAAELEATSVIKAAQAVSGELVLENLVRTLLSLAVKEAGAERGLLILMHHDVPRIEAQATTDHSTLAQNAIAIQVAPAELSAEQLPLTLVHYVMRSQRSVIVANATQSQPFLTDVYFRHQMPKAVLCKPLMKQGRLMGLLYLENTMTAGVFTPARMAVLEVLTAQAAISLENAYLYSGVRERESRIRCLIDANVVGVFFWHLNGKILDGNENFLNLVGYSRDELRTGQLTWQAINPAEYDEWDRRLVEQMHLSGSVVPHERDLLRRDGTRVPVMMGAAFFEGALDRGVSFVLDITERRQAELERSARRAAEAANRAKSEFLATMSHELRTPLNAILGYAQLFAYDRSLSERHRARMAVIRHSGEHLLALINEVLDVAKIEAGRLTLEPSPLSLPGFLANIHDIILVKAQEKGLGLKWNIAADLPHAVLADGRRLRQVLLNLLANAVKFTDLGRVSLSIAFSTPACFHFEVCDTGIGMSSDQLGGLFEPFEQLGEGRRRGGTGLGLAISRRLLRLMGGDIQVRSQPGIGSTFSFQLDLPVTEMEFRESEPETVILGYQGPRKTVLVVDDVAENRALLIDLLQPLGFTVTDAANGSEALDRASHTRPDLIVMDIIMPDMDGRDIILRIRELPDLAGVPVIFVSASASDDGLTGIAADSGAANADTFLPKPLDAAELLRRIGALLKLEWLHAQAAQGRRA